MVHNTARTRDYTEFFREWIMVQTALFTMLENILNRIWTRLALTSISDFYQIRVAQNTVSKKTKILLSKLHYS